MENNTPLKSFPCKLHPSEPVQRVLKSKDTDNCLRCVECILANVDNAPKSAFISLNDFIQEAAKHYGSNSGSQTLDGPVPNELIEFLSSRESSIHKLNQHVDQEKAKVIDIFDSLQQKFTHLCQSKKEELCKQLDLQVDTLKLNYKYYESTIHKYFNQDSQEGDLDKDALISKINECSDTNELEVVVKNIKDDIEASSASTNRNEAKTLLKESLAILAEELRSTLETRPKTSFLQENYHEEYLKNFNDLVDRFIESCSPITSKVEEISFKKGFAVNSKIIQQPDFELLRKWIHPSQSAVPRLKLLYRASKNGFNLRSFHEHCDNYEDTLVIAKTQDDKIYGGFSDQLWNDNTDMVCESEKSWLFNLSDKTKYALPEDSKADIGTTFGAGFYFGINSDFTLIFSDDLQGKTFGDAPKLQSQCYATFNPVNYQDLTKQKNQSSILQPLQMTALQSLFSLPSKPGTALNISPQQTLQQLQQIQLQRQFQQQQQQQLKPLQSSAHRPGQQVQSFQKRSGPKHTQEQVIQYQLSQLLALETQQTGPYSKISRPNGPFRIKEIEVFHLLPTESTP